MNRSLSLCSVVAVATLALAGCDKSAADAQDKANNAQAEANKTSANAQAEADKKTKNAQAEADKKIAEAQGDFAKAREDYRHSTQTKLDALDKKIAILEADAKKATGKAKTDLEVKLANVRVQRTTFANDFKTLDAASATTWDSTKTRLDKSWIDLENAVDKRT